METANTESSLRNRGYIDGVKLGNVLKSSPNVIAYIAPSNANNLYRMNVNLQFSDFLMNRYLTEIHLIILLWSNYETCHSFRAALEFLTIEDLVQCN